MVSEETLDTPVPILREAKGTTRKTADFARCETLCGEPELHWAKRVNGRPPYGEQLTFTAHDQDVFLFYPAEHFPPKCQLPVDLVGKVRLVLREKCIFGLPCKQHPL